MRQTASLDTTADLDAAWDALVDVASWPQWTASMTAVERLDEGPLRVGSRARIKQPGFPWLVWEVSELRDRSEFTWVTTALGTRTEGRHVLEGNPDGTTRITLVIDQTGPLGVVFGTLTAGKTRRFLALEAAGLKAASEAA
jgi:Polyketide cyclase / dehydrase and lipid transport